MLRDANTFDILLMLLRAWQRRCSVEPDLNAQRGASTACSTEPFPEQLGKRVPPPSGERCDCCMVWD